MHKDTFVWTEVYNCGEIGAIAISSFLKHHPDTVVHVYGAAEDLMFIPEAPTIRKAMLPSDLSSSFSSWLWRTLGIGKPSIWELPEKRFFTRTSWNCALVGLPYHLPARNQDDSLRQRYRLSG